MYLSNIGIFVNIPTYFSILEDVTLQRAGVTEPGSLFLAYVLGSLVLEWIL